MTTGLGGSLGPVWRLHPGPLVGRTVAPEWAIGGSRAAFVLALALVLLGPVLNLSHWVIDASPFAHSAKLPGTPVAVTPLIWLTAVAAALTAAGLRRRDIG